MATAPMASKDTIIVLFKAGRLQSWNSLTPDQRLAYEQEHIDLMLSVGHKHQIMRLEAFALMGAQQPWARFWVIEFPTLDGAEEWVNAEMAPPYGSYGYYEYYLARRWGPDYFTTWVTRPRSPMPALAGQGPDRIPGLEIDRDSVIVVMFGRGLPGSEAMTREERGDQEHIDLMKSVARDHGLIRLDGFRLIAPRDDWHRAWVIELPTLEGAEAWMEAEIRPPYGTYNTKTYHLARNYFSADIARFKPRGPTG